MTVAQSNPKPELLAGQDFLETGQYYNPKFQSFSVTTNGQRTAGFFGVGLTAGHVVGQRKEWIQAPFEHGKRAGESVSVKAFCADVADEVLWDDDRIVAILRPTEAFIGDKFLPTFNVSWIKDAIETSKTTSILPDSSECLKGPFRRFQCIEREGDGSQTVAGHGMTIDDVMAGYRAEWERCSVNDRCCIELSPGASKPATYGRFKTSQGFGWFRTRRLSLSGSLTCSKRQASGRLSFSC